VSPKSVTLLLLLSVTVAVLVASIAGNRDKLVSVGSFVVLPSVSSPSSLRSVTLLVFPGEEAVASTVFTTLPLSTAC
jgi:hypothetical protein